MWFDTWEMSMLELGFAGRKANDDTERIGLPGVPNTTHIMQETDQSFGLFKTNYRKNLESLAEYRHPRLSVEDHRLGLACLWWTS